MKYKLTNCEIKQLSDNIFEATPREGIVVDKNCVEECGELWNYLRDKPFGLLINCQNQYRHSYSGSREMGKHPLQKKTAILCNNAEQEVEMKTIIEIKKLTENSFNHNFFSDRDKAIKWLSDI